MARRRGPDLSHIAEELRPLAVGLERLAGDPRNARLHGDRNLAAVQASLTRFGQRKPLVARRVGEQLVLEAGHGTVDAARRLGWTHLAVVTVADEEAEAQAFALADNRTAELAEWDQGALLGALRLVEEGGIPLVDVGWTPAEVRDLEPPVNGTDPGPEEPPTSPLSEAGEVYQLGPHRLACGDSTDPECLARLMQGELAGLMATDPPYLVNYQGGNHPQSSCNNPNVKDKRWEEYNEAIDVDLFVRFLANCLPHCAENVAVYQWHASRRSSLIEQAWEKNGLLVHVTVVWVKERPVLTHSHFMWQSEPAHYGFRVGQGNNVVRPPANVSNVWHINQVGQQDGIHPTQKPTEIFARPMGWHLKPGELALEPFGGSGSCLIAAAMEGRRCYAVELSRAFCDVIRRRWGEWARSAGVDPGPGAL